MIEDTFVTVIATHDGAREKFITGMTHAKSILDNGGAVELRVGPATKPIEIAQRNFLHGAVLKQISEQVEVEIFDVAGAPTGRKSRHVIGVWKDYFRDRFLPAQFEMKQGFIRDKKSGQWRMAKKATPHRIPVDSEKLGPARYAKWTDQIIDHAVTELGVEFVFETGEREGARYVNRSRKGPVQ